MKVWVCGMSLDDDPWSLLGVFDSEEQAKAACTHWRHFYGECELNKRLSDDTAEEWPGFTYPCPAPPAPRSERFPDDHLCPRGAENCHAGKSFWRPDHTCYYCGSLNPVLFMERLEAGDVRIVPTDKNYKVYVASTGGDDLGHQKFYFQHLNDDQKTRFLQLLNDKRIDFAAPGHFYVTPFFLKKSDNG